MSEWISELEEIILDRAIADVDEAVPHVFVDDPQDIETNEDAPDGQESSRCRVVQVFTGYGRWRKLDDVYFPLNFQTAPLINQCFIVQRSGSTRI